MGLPPPALCSSYVCIDIDECILDKHTCSDVCNNTIGGFNCDCFSGYKLQRDGFNCVGKGSFTD